MSDVDGGAPAPVDSAPAPEAQVEAPAPIRDEPIAPEPAPEPKPDDKPKEPVSTREALKKAAEKVEADSKDKPAEKPKPVEDKGPARGEGGKFAPKEGAEPAEKTAQAVDAKPAAEAPKPAKSAYEPPTSYSPEAKAEWQAVPESTKAAIAKREAEIAAGSEKHKADREAFEPLRQYHEMAKQGGTKLETALQAYVSTEQLLRQDPIKGFEQIAQNLGVSFRQVAEHYLGQPSDQQQNAKDVEIAQLKQVVQRLEQGFTSFKGDLESREVQQTIHAFKADPKHTRFDELQPDIGMFLQTGRANTLSEAYEMAERLNPAPQSAAPAPAAPKVVDPSPEAQSLKGSKSINGAPGPGSDPAQRKPSNSIKESLRRAVAQAG